MLPTRIDKQLRPEERLKQLLEHSTYVGVDYTVNAKFYYKSGINMYRQFNIFYNEGNWENALCLYLKYEKLFFDKIRKHPEYDKIPVGVKSVNEANYRLMKPKAEHAKRELFKLYKRDFLSYVDEIKAMKKEFSSKTQEEKTLLETHEKTSGTITGPELVAPPLDSFFLANSTFEIKSEVSFNTSRKMTDMHRKLQEANNEQQRAGYLSKVNQESTTSNISKSSAGRQVKGSSISSTNGRPLYKSPTGSSGRMPQTSSRRLSGAIIAASSSAPRPSILKHTFSKDSLENK